MDKAIIDRLLDHRAGLPRRPVPLGIGLFDRLLRVTGANDVAGKSEAKIAAMQKPLPDNRFMRFLLGAPAPGVERRDVPVRIDGVRYKFRLYGKSNAPTTGTLLYFHGGGFVRGDAAQCDWWCSHFAAATGALVASFEYRLAPRHRFPAAHDDCYRALCWLAENGVALGAGGGPLAVGGESAGANLAASLCILVRDRAGPAIAAQILLYPTLDLTLSSPSIRENGNAPILTEPAMRAYRALYLAGHDPRDPRVSPLFAADVTRLPPALIQVAEHDPLRDDGWRYALRLRDAGVPATITEYAGAPHGFLSFPGLTGLARQGLAEATSFFRELGG